MNKHYTQIAEVQIPCHDDEERATTIHIFDVDDEKAEEIDCSAYENDVNEYDHAAVDKIVRDDLDIHDDYFVMPGALFHRYGIEFRFPHTVFVYDTIAYNV